MLVRFPDGGFQVVYPLGKMGAGQLELCTWFWDIPTTWDVYVCFT